jgi:hypothetical protein
MLSFIYKGKVKLTVVSQSGKEATIGILNEGGSSQKVALQGSLSACAPQPQ